MSERKLLPQFTKSIEDRTVTGIFAVHGHVDDGNDRSWPGSLANIAINGRKRARFLWMHRGEDPPIAVINEIRELTRDELPTSVLTYAPDATGGAQITRTYLDTPRGNEVLIGLKSGAIEEMSYRYETVKHDFETSESVQIRNLRQMNIFDVSDVNWGLQEATVAVKSGLLTGLTLPDHSETVLAAATELIERYEGVSALRAKSGRVLSAANVSRLSTLKDSLAGLIGELEALLAAAEPEKHKSRQQLRAESLRLRARILGVHS
jgi:hypothetical protein